MMQPRRYCVCGLPAPIATPCPICHPLAPPDASLQGWEESWDGAGREGMGWGGAVALRTQAGGKLCSLCHTPTLSLHPGCSLHVQVWRADMEHGKHHPPLPGHPGTAIRMSLASWLPPFPLLTPPVQSHSDSHCSPAFMHLQNPVPRAPSFPHNSVFGNFPIFASSNGHSHPESCLGDVLTSPGPTSLARPVLVMWFHVATWATRAVIGTGGSCQNIRHLSQPPTQASAARQGSRWHSEMPMGTFPSSCHHSQSSSPG